jgi:hypothetical protein
MGKYKTRPIKLRRRIQGMEPRDNEWTDALSEQDIPAAVVDWDSIIAPPEASQVSDSEKLDAERTLEDTSPLES